MERIFENSERQIEAYKTPRREGYYYSDGKFEYTPVGWAKIVDRWYPLGYRVTTLDNKSLGLDHNTNILTYKLFEWVGIDKKDLVADIHGRGGPWTAINLSDARTLRTHCLTRTDYKLRTRIYLAAVKNPVFATSYRVKSQAIMLLGEIE